MLLSVTSVVQIQRGYVNLDIPYAIGEVLGAVLLCLPFAFAQHLDASTVE